MDPFILRPIKLSDLDKLHKIIKAMKAPIASLPSDKAILKKRIQFSLRSFKQHDGENKPAYYFFVLENIQTKEILGVSGIYSNTGGHNSLYLYEIREEKFDHTPLNISKIISVLHIKKVHHGPSELWSLYIDPQYRGHKLAQLLSFGRHLFINSFPNCFSDQIIANLRGFRDEDEQSPFWNALGKFFFEGKLAAVDEMKSLGHKAFIKDLMPRHPIYIPLLPKEAQNAIGKVHKKTEPALHLLHKQGFKENGWVDLFDAGPYLIANRNQIQIIKHTQTATVSTILPSHNNTLENPPYLISNNSVKFRACRGNLTINPDHTVSLPQDMANALNLTTGGSISYVAL